MFMQNEEKETVVIVLCTAPPGMAHTITTQLLERNLAACVNIPG